MNFPAEMKLVDLDHTQLTIRRQLSFSGQLTLFGQFQEGQM